MGKIIKRDGRWGIDYRDHLGRRIRKMVSGDRAVAQKLLGDAIDAAEKMKAGMLMADPREARLPLERHLDPYIDELRRRGRDRMYTYTCRKRIEMAAKDRRWLCLADCSARSVTSYLKSLADQGLVPKTVNGHRADLNAFFGWCVRTGRLEANPCATVAKTVDRRGKTRRALSVAECRALIKAAPPERARAYLFLICTGLRRAEATGILWDYLRLDVANPSLELPASIIKSGQLEAVPVGPELATALREHRGDAPDGAPVFQAIPSMEEFRRDLRAAGIPEQDHRGRKVVLHSLRHSLATMMVTSNVPMAVAQRIMRHRDIRLTAETYCDEGLLPLASAMAALPSLTA